jgi:hypothetical protein
MSSRWIEVRIDRTVPNGPVGQRISLNLHPGFPLALAQVRVAVRHDVLGEAVVFDEVFVSDEELGHECCADISRGCQRALAERRDLYSQV